ncbi:hypothetical protein GIB67_031231 [Kingdonia uniflora]|uniref:TF-B3 domain-containing protein n=1 Tax=Kingdonia uniflora TaxID=39325 RepID=A0A7J7NL43_9MAGN|nr:hypothetical protein GIB67_031231 [Kingdonia uniflora]
MSSSSSSMKICFNPTCEDSTTTSSERFRKGWRLRNGDLVDLCDRCASAYEDGRFCETCHKDATGWRNCEACRKPLHCGCIVSIPAFVLLDAGGVACNACAGKNVVIASNQRWPSSLFMALHVPETLQDFSVKNWSTIAGANVIGGQRVQPPNIQDTTTVQPEFHRRVPSEIDRSNHSKLADTERPTTSVQEKIEKEDPLKRVSCSSLGLSAIDRLGNGKGAVSIGAALSTCHKDEGGKDGLQSSHPPLSENMELKKGVFAQSKSCVNVLLDSSTSKDDPSTPHFGLIAPYTLQDETSSIRVSGAQSVRQTPPPTFANGKDSSGVTQVPNGKMRLDAWGRNLLPRYWPKITDQELQQKSFITCLFLVPASNPTCYSLTYLSSNSAFTPLFEKVLSASDAGRIGRLVLPKKCAEAYFPAIYNPEGVPIEVQDVKGTLWTFQYRFWPNNKSRISVRGDPASCIGATLVGSNKRGDPESHRGGTHAGSSERGRRDTPNGDADDRGEGRKFRGQRRGRSVTMRRDKKYLRIDYGRPIASPTANKGKGSTYVVIDVLWSG